MASYDAGKLTNQSKRSARIYKDLNLDFQQNTATKDIQKMLDVEAVKRSVKNLISLNHYEKPFHPEIGSNLRGMLFENITAQMSHYIGKQIETWHHTSGCRMWLKVERSTQTHQIFSVKACHSELDKITKKEKSK